MAQGASDWSAAFSEDVAQDSLELSPLPAPSFKGGQTSANSQTFSSAALAIQVASEDDDEAVDMPSNPFTKAAFNHAVMQSRKPPASTAASSSKVTKATAPSLALSRPQKRKADPLRDAFSKQASKAKRQQQPQPAASRPSKAAKVVPAQSFFAKYLRNKSASVSNKTPKSQQPKIRSPPVCVKPRTLSKEASGTLPAPRVQYRGLKDAHPPGKTSKAQEYQNDQQIADQEHLSQAGSVLSEPVQAAPSGFRLAEIHEPEMPSISQGRSARYEDALEDDPDFASLFFTKPSDPPSSWLGPAQNTMQRDTGFSREHAQGGWSLSKSSPLSQPEAPRAPPVTSAGPSQAKDEAIDLSSSWSTLKNKPPPPRPYARPQHAQSRPGVLPGLVPSSSVSLASQTRRLRAFEPPVPLQQWRADRH